MTDLLFLSYKPDVPPDDYWDMGLLKALFSGDVWDAVGMDQLRIRKSLQEVSEGAVVVFPARSQVDCIDKLNADIKRLKWLVLILTGDEANEFPADKVKHPNMKLWIMSANPEKHVEGARKIGSGFPPQALKYLPEMGTKALRRPLDYFFAGQITHERRQMLATELDTLKEFQEHNGLEGEYVFSAGFTQGMKHEDYYATLAAAKVAPCPSGPESPDSFRLYEALEAGCVPVVDAYSPKLRHDNYWTWFFDEEPPFPVYTDANQIRGYITDSAERYVPLGNRIFAWWQSKKRQMAYWLRNDIKDLNGGIIELDGGNMRDWITVIMPSSPIPSHPSTDMIEQTIRDVRIQLPNSEILITVDGIRPEQESYRPAYEEYTRRLLWKANHEWHNVLPITFDEHHHQASMARKVLEQVKTPTILYVEHDTPLTPDRPFQWRELVQSVVDGTANVIRFSHESKILDEHRHLILSAAENHEGALLTKTQQWSQRPHLASTAFYRHMLDTYFHPESLTMIEDVMHSIVEQDMGAHGSQAWYNWRIWLYTPDTDPDGSILRSYNLDGRKDDTKYDMIIKPIERN